jgi:capsule polysaccharide export protein KpsE/RkpR
MSQPSDETVRVPRSPQAMYTEMELAHAALQAAIRSRDKAGIDAARIWLGNLQVQERQARLLLLESGR